MIKQAGYVGWQSANDPSSCWVTLEVCVYPNGRVPLPVLRCRFVVSFLRLWFERLVLLLRHFHHGVLWLLQLSAFLGGALPSPTYLA